MPSAALESSMNKNSFTHKKIFRLGLQLGAEYGARELAMPTLSWPVTAPSKKA